MRFGVSAETDAAAGPYVLDLVRGLREAVRAGLETSALEPLEIEVLYVPIVMSDALRSHYPARSRLRRSRNLFACSPQLDHALIVGDDLARRVAEFVRGLDECRAALPRLDVSAQAVADFMGLVEQARRRVLSDLQARAAAPAGGPANDGEG